MDEAEADRQAARGEEKLAGWLKDHPGSKGWQDDDGWRGTVDVDGTRWLGAGRHDTPEGLIAALDARAFDATEVRAIEADHPGWLARRYSDGGWQAVRPLGDRRVPLHVTAGDAAGLREAIKAGEAGAQ